MVFRGDFESGDLSQWSYLLKEEGLSIVTDPVAEGTRACKVAISKNELWSNGMNRVEVQYSPPPQYVADGAELFYAYSFYLPEALTSDNHQILYWETSQTYQQILQLAIEGERMYFATQKPAFTIHWDAPTAASAGKWHRVAMRIKWSTDANVGEVDLWFNGDQVVTGAKAVTYLGNPAFVQQGILRKTIDKVETLYMDDARLGTTLEDVMSPSTPGSGGGGAVAGSAGSSSASGGTSSGGSSGAGATPEESSDGCSFRRVANTGSRAPGSGLAALAFLLAAFARRRLPSAGRP